MEDWQQVNFKSYALNGSSPGIILMEINFEGKD